MRPHFNNIEIRRPLNIRRSSIADFAALYVKIMDVVHQLVEQIQGDARPGDVIQLELRGNLVETAPRPLCRRN